MIKSLFLSSKALENENVNLFTIDVEKLYPSIQPELALQAIHDALDADTSTDRKTKIAIEHFIRLSFEQSYVSYQNECYKSKIGIPTGGSLSRQIADIFLHWILFIKMTPKLSVNAAVRFWVRFIDDCIGIWRGTKRSFDIFIKQLNAETSKYGIYFPINEIQFGKSVHMLDLCVYLDEFNIIHRKGYSKPTDAKRYLNPNSFHPRQVFQSIPFSQMLRTMRNNSKEETKSIQLDECIKHFENSNYNTTNLMEIKQRAIERSNTVNEPDVTQQDTLVFPVHYFEGLSELKKLIQGLSSEFQQLIGDTRVMIATKKQSSIGNQFVRNKQLSVLKDTAADNQRCNARGCRQCPLTNDKQKIIINDQIVQIPRHLSCKSKHVIYMWICKLCQEKEAYFGRTIQECHKRTSGHRGAFTEEKWDKSALSMHAWEAHRTSFSLDIFSVSIVKKVSPQQLRREEFKFIEKYRTLTHGLNRYKV